MSKADLGRDAPESDRNEPAPHPVQAVWPKTAAVVPVHLPADAPLAGLGRAGQPRRKEGVAPSHRAVEGALRVWRRDGRASG